jgi:2-deoxy-D-gluconate 3-dehydrogenase
MSDNPFDLSSRVALVTGGNTGIGFGVAEGLIAAGAIVMLAARDQAKSQTAITALRQAHGNAEGVVADVTNENSCRAMIASTVEAFGRLDILVNNAGIFLGGRPEEMDLVDWNKVFATNLTGAFVAAQTAYPHMKRQGGGKIINIASVMSNFATGQGHAYGASKAALVQLSRSLAVAWATDNIQVNSVLPGFIDTEMTRRGREAIPELNDVVMRRTPAGRWGTPRDLAGVAVFLASDASNFVTGSAITVDGGWAVRA